MIKELQFEDNFEKIGDYYVMTRQVVHSQENDQVITTEFNYSNITALFY